MQTLMILNWLSELIQLVFEMGEFTRKYVVPAVVYAYVFVEYYVVGNIVKMHQGWITEQPVRVPVLAVFAK